jgi:hypothetical protein
MSQSNFTSILDDSISSSRIIIINKSHLQHQLVHKLSVTILLLAVTCLGFILNALSLAVLHNARFTCPLYTYIRIMCFTSMLANTLQLFLALATSAVLITPSTSYLARAYMAFIYSPVHNTLMFYKFVIDALCTFDCIIKFKPITHRCLKISPQLKSLLAFVLVVALSFPHYLYFWPYGDGSYAVIDESPFAKSTDGKTIISTFLGVRSAAIFLIDVSLNSILIYLFRDYLKKKAALNSNSNQIISASSSSQQHINCRFNRLNGLKHRPAYAAHMNSVVVRRGDRVADCSLTKMIAVLTGISILHQIILNVNLVFVSSAGGVNSYSSVTIFVNFCFSILRHGSNFFIFIKFSNKFKAELKRKFQVFKG